jgi:sorbitol-6-phosphate 2-dehydrogenase
MSQTLKDKIALVTGGAQGLGAAIALRLAREGCDVAIADINEESSAATAAQITRETGRRTIAMKIDVTDEAQVSAGIDRTVQELGRLDICVSNAGILFAEEITEFPAEKWKAVIMVNLFGYFLVSKHAARVMVAQRSGAIIQINSQSIALDLAEFGVRVNAVCPGNLLDSPLWVDSLYKQYAKKWGITEEEVRQRYIDQVPMKRGCTYEDVCNVVVFLASDQSSYMTGQAINVTGGQEMR